MTTSLAGALLLAIPCGAHAADFDLNGNSETLPQGPTHFNGLGYLNGTDGVTNNGPTPGIIAMLTEGHNEAAPVNYSGTISDGTALTGINHTSGHTIFSGVSNTYSGGTIIGGGSITAVNATALGTGLVTVENGGAIVLDSATGFAIANGVRIEGDGDGSGALFNRQGSNAINETVQLRGNALIGSDGRLAIDVVDASFTAAGATLTTGGAGTVVIGDIGNRIGNLVVNATGGLEITGTGAHTGDTTVQNGTLRLLNGAAIGDSGRVIVDATGALQIVNSETIGSLAGAGDVEIGTGQTLTTGGDNTSTTVSGVLSGAGALTKTGTGTLTLSGTNTYSGTTTIDGGTLAISGGGAIANAGAVVVNAAGRLSILSSETIGSLAGAGDVEIGAGQTLTTGGDNTSTTFSGVITGTTGALEKTGTGTLTLTGVNTYGGGTTLSDGRIHISNGSALGTGALDLAGGVLQADTSMSFGNTINVTAHSWIDTGANTLMLTGALGGTSSFSKGGTGTLVFGATLNTSGHSGGMTLAGGTLSLQGNLAAGFGTITTTGSVIDYASGITNAAAIDINSNTTQLQVLTGTATQSGVISETGGARPLEKIGAGTLVLTGTNTYTGGTTISAGTLQIGNGGTAGSITGNVINNATLAFNRSDASTFGGAISGSGAVTKNGAGTLTLSGTNTYTGGTTISAGAINVQNNSALGTEAVTVENGAALELQGPRALDNALTLNGSGIANGGALRNISGTSTSNGAITLGSASRINSDAGQLNLTTVTGSNVDLTVGGAGATYAGDAVALGTGSVTKDGTGTLYLAGTNSFAGLSIENGGVWLLGNNAVADTSAVTMVAGTTFTLSATETVGSVAGAGNISISGGQQLRTGFDNTSTTFSGVISERIGIGALVKIGTGTFTLSGVSTYTGATTVDGGTLSLGLSGSIATSSLTTVNASGTIGGNGTVGNLAINGGTLAPGNSIGVLNVQGNLSLTAASSYMVEVSPTNADRVDVTGTATLGNATVHAHFAPGSYVAKQYTIVNAAGGVNGTFGTQVNTDLPATFNSTLSYDGNNAYLNLALAFDPTFGSGLNRNQQGVANTLTDFFNRTGGIPLVFGELSPAGLTQASGELGSGSQQTTFDAMNLFMSVMTDPFTAGRGGIATGAAGYADEARAIAGQRSPTDAFASMHRKAPPMAPAFEERWNIWVAGFGGSRNTDGSSLTGSNNTTSNIYGTAVGADYWFSPNTVAGFSLAGGGTSFSVNGGGSGRSELFQAGAFVRHSVGSAYVTAAAAYGWQDISTDRTVAAAGFERLHAKFNANAWSGRIEAGHRILTSWLPGVGVTPYGAVQVTAFDLPSYAETGSGGATTFALAYAGKTVTTTRTELGLRSDKSLALNDAILTLRGRAAWAHDFNTDRNIAATFQALPGASFVVNGAAQARSAALTTASAEMKWTNGWSVAGTFEGEFSDVTRSYSGKGVVRYAW